MTQLTFDVKIQQWKNQHYHHQQNYHHQEHYHHQQNYHHHQQNYHYLCHQQHEINHHQITYNNTTTIIITIITSSSKMRPERLTFIFNSKISVGPVRAHIRPTSYKPCIIVLHVIESPVSCRPQRFFYKYTISFPFFRHRILLFTSKTG